MTLKTKALHKPLLRGVLHQEAFFVALGACAMLVAKASTDDARLTSLVYSFGLLFLFGVSAVYHRPHWQPKQRAVLKRLDHSAIFIFIAGTVTPMSLLALPPEEGQELFAIIWIVAVAGLLQSIFWVKAPKWFTAIIYVTMGWIAVPYVRGLESSLGSSSLWLIFVGGVAYTVGAICYATHRPHLVPRVFGYHEVFHLLTVIAAACHFVVIYRLIQ
jgi:hemolysin III